MSRANLSSSRRVVIKLGTRVLTDAENALDIGVLNRMAEQAGSLLARGVQVVVVTSAAIAVGLERMGRSERPREITLLQAAASLGQSRLMQAYEDAFAAVSCRTAQILLTLEDIQDRARYLNVRNTILTLWDVGAVPVINENDAVSFAEIIRFGDNDVLGAHIANMMDADLYLLLTDTEGLFTSDPRRDSSSRVIPELPEITDRHIAEAGGTGSSQSSGGMQAKLRAARIASRSGVGVVIANGRTVDILALLAGEEIGTYVPPQGDRIRGKKKWIAFNPGVAGTVVVDEGGERAIVQQRRSLLPAGVVDVGGDFPMGSNVRVENRAGREIARGLVNFSSEELRRIRGLHTSRIGQVLDSDTYFDEVVHRDNLVIT